eukprot:25042-Pelagomonas_calceolata.AAC.1
MLASPVPALAHLIHRLMDPIGSRAHMGVGDGLMCGAERIVLGESLCASYKLQCSLHDPNASNFRSATPTIQGDQTICATSACSQPASKDLPGTEVDTF